MAEIMLNVPHFKQQKSMTCWYACARMVKSYKRLTPVSGLPDHYANNWGVKMPEVIRLAETEGFTFLPYTISPYSVSTLLNTVAQHGPIWVNTSTSGGGQHAIVVTGVSNEMGDDVVFHNDPGTDEGVNAIMPLERFNYVHAATQQLYYPPNMT